MSRKNCLGFVPLAVLGLAFLFVSLVGITIATNNTAKNLALSAFAKTPFHNPQANVNKFAASPDYSAAVLDKYKGQAAVDLLNSAPTNGQIQGEQRIISDAVSKAITDPNYRADTLAKSNPDLASLAEKVSLKLTAKVGFSPDESTAGNPNAVRPASGLSPDESAARNPSAVNPASGLSPDEARVAGSLPSTTKVGGAPISGLSPDESAGSPSIETHVHYERVINGTTYKNYKIIDVTANIPGQKSVTNTTRVVDNSLGLTSELPKDTYKIETVPVTSSKAQPAGQPAGSSLDQQKTGSSTINNTIKATVALPNYKNTLVDIQGLAGLGSVTPIVKEQTMATSTYVQSPHTYSVSANGTSSTGDTTTGQVIGNFTGYRTDKLVTYNAGGKILDIRVNKYDVLPNGTLYERKIDTYVSTTVERLGTFLDHFVHPSLYP